MFLYYITFKPTWTKTLCYVKVRCLIREDFGIQKSNFFKSIMIYAANVLTFWLKKSLMVNFIFWSVQLFLKIHVSNHHFCVSFNEQRCIPSVTRQKGESQNGVSRKQTIPNFLKKGTFEAPVFRFALFPCYRRLRSQSNICKEAFSQKYKTPKSC